MQIYSKYYDKGSDITNMWGGDKSMNLCGHVSFAVHLIHLPVGQISIYNCLSDVWKVWYADRRRSKASPNCQSHVTFFVDLSNYVSRHVSHQTQSRLSDQAVLIKYKLGFCWSIVYFPPQMFSETQFLFTFVTRPLFFMLYHRLNQPVGVAHCHITHFELLWLVIGYILLFWLTEGHFLFALIGYRLIRLCPGAFWSASVDYTSSKS